MKKISGETAELIAAQALQYLAGDSEQISRFVALTGIEPGSIRELAGEKSFLAGVLDHFLADEPSLLAFTADRNLDPNDVAMARHILDPQDPGYST